MPTCRTRWLSFVVGLALTLQPACGDGGDTGGRPSDGGTTAIATVADLAGPVARAFCDRLTTCSPAVVLVFSPLGCEAVLRPAFDRVFAEAQQRVDDGELTFDSGEARACVDAVGALACSELSLDLDLTKFGPACRRAITGNRPAGEICREDIDCAPSLYCDRSADCPGTCAEPIAAGASCQLGQRCAGGYRCFVPPSSVGTTGACVPPAGEGEACDTEAGPPCAVALRCDTPDGETAGTCARGTDVTTGAAVGEPCGLPGRRMATLCADGLACVVSGGLTGTCQAAGIAEGEACPLAMLDPCAEGLYCDGAMPQAGGAGTCKRLPTAGEPCGRLATALGDDSLFFADGLCGPGLVCDRTESPPTCVEFRANGQPCRSNKVCLSGYCETVGGSDMGTCRTRSACF